MTDIFLSDKAFVGIILSAIEVYKNECMGDFYFENIRKDYAFSHAEEIVQKLHSPL